MPSARMMLASLPDCTAMPWINSSTVTASLIGTNIAEVPDGAPPVAPSAIAARGQIYTASGMQDLPVPRALERGRNELRLQLEGLDPATLFSPDTAVIVVTGDSGVAGAVAPSSSGIYASWGRIRVNSTASPQGWQRARAPSLF